MRFMMRMAFRRAGINRENWLLSMNFMICLRCIGMVHLILLQEFYLWWILDTLQRLIKKTIVRKEKVKVTG